MPDPVEAEDAQRVEQEQQPQSDQHNRADRLASRHGRIGIDIKRRNRAHRGNNGGTAV